MSRHLPSPSFLNTVATEARDRNMRLVLRTEYHWQIVAGMTLLTSIWPTRLKKADGWPVAKIADVFHSETALLDSVKTLLDRYLADKPVSLLQHMANTGKQLSMFDSEPQPKTSKPVLFTPNLQRRMATLDLSLEGADLRIIINSRSHSDSFRLSKRDTMTFLLKAKKALDELRCPTAEQAELDDCTEEPMETTHEQQRDCDRQEAAEDRPCPGRHPGDGTGLDARAGD